MYRCKVCRRHTEDIDDSPCLDDSHVFDPLEITTIHKLDFVDGKRTVFCSGKLQTQTTKGVGSWLGVNCVRCRTKKKQALDAEKAAAEESTQSTESTQKP